MHTRTRALAFLALLLLLPTGCDSESKPKPGKLSKLDGDEQCVPLSRDFARRLTKMPLRVKVETEAKSGLLGGKESSEPVFGAKVLFQIVGKSRGASLCFGDPGAAGVEGEPVLRLETGTDGGGMAAAYVRVGNEIGDIVVEVSLPDFGWVENRESGGHSGIKAVKFHVIAGLGLESPSGLDAKSGSIPEEPIGLRLTGPGGEPLADVPVIWHVEKGPLKTRLVRADGKTDVEGRAATQVEMGAGTGQVIVAATASDPDRGVAFRPVRFKLFSLDFTEIFISVIGGLALFIMGMKIMTDGLTRVAGAKMRAILQSVTKNTLVGVGAGAAVTAVIQSSSATSVMVIGFVNAGLISLEQAIGLIMGANIGTTVTAQMISFELSALALPAVAVGTIIQLASKRKTTQHWGLVLAGFGLLFIGLTTMSGALKGLQDSETVCGFFCSINCAPEPCGTMPMGKVLLAIGIGTFATFLVQSSSAAIGLLLALASANLINFHTAVPLLLGSNIGTTTTAMLAVIGANRSARRTAVAHALFNILGTLLMCVFFFLTWNGHPIYLEVVDRMSSGDAFAGENIERHIANAHTLFNVICTIVFLPLVGVLAWLCRKIVPETTDEKEEGPRYLEPHLLDTPVLALERAGSELVYMTALSRKAVAENFDAFLSGKMPNHEKVERRETCIDELQHDITDYLVRLSQRDLIEAESRQLPLLIHSVNDAERIGDHAENLAELAERRVECKLPLSEDAQRELREMFGEVEAMFGHVLAALESGNRTACERALHCEKRINNLHRELSKNHTQRLECGNCSLTSGVAFLDVVANLEKIGDHLANIAQAGQALTEARSPTP
jgi:Na/Pi-cotransporter